MDHKLIHGQERISILRVENGWVVSHGQSTFVALDSGAVLPILEIFFDKIIENEGINIETSQTSN